LSYFIFSISGIRPSYPFTVKTFPLAAVFGSGTCRACALVNASAQVSAAAMTFCLIVVFIVPSLLGFSLSSIIFFL